MNASNRSYPEQVLARIARLELRARQVVEGLLTGWHRSPFKGFSVEFAEHRPYVPGDDLRHIDWRVFAKSDRFYVKEHEVETNVRAHLLLDCSGSMAYPSDADGAERLSKWDYAATLAVALAHLLVVAQGDAVGLTLFDDRLRAQLPVRASQAALADLAAMIEQHRPSGVTDTALPFAELVERLPPRGMVILLSDLLTEADPLLAGLQRFVAAHHAHHDVIALQILDADELDFPFTDPARFQDLEDEQSSLRADPQSLRGSYLAAIEAFVARIRRACLEQQIDYALINTAQPPATALSSFLAARLARQRQQRR